MILKQSATNQLHFQPGIDLREYELLTFSFYQNGQCVAKYLSTDTDYVKLNPDYSVDIYMVASVAKKFGPQRVSFEICTWDGDIYELLVSETMDVEICRSNERTSIVDTDDSEITDSRIRAEIERISSKYIPKNVSDKVDELDDKVAELDENLGGAIEDWYEEHPEATTRVEDNTLTTAKFEPALRQKIDSRVKYIFPRNFGADVKDGDCNLIIADGVSILIDCHREVAWTQVQTFLDDNGVSHLDYFILSHYHGDHYQNIPSLISNGYIDADTVCYLPPVGDYLSRTTGSPEQAATVNGWFTSAGINTIVPEEWEYFEPTPTVKVTFYNCDPTVWNASSWPTDYNECSMICLVEHGTNTALYTGDCYAVSLARALENGFINRHIDLYKINHHGINATDAMYPILTKINPTYAVQPSSMGDDLKNNHDKNVEMQTLQLLGCKIYQCHANEIDIILESTVDSFTATQGHSTAYGGAHTQTQYIYVDISTTDDVQDGSQQHPFKDLSQALACCVPGAPVIYRFYLADGTYNESHETPAKNKFRFSKSRVYMYGNSSNVGNVIVKNGFELFDSTFYAENITFDCSTSPCNLNNTDARFVSCVFTGNAGSGNQLELRHFAAASVESSTKFENFVTAISVSTNSDLKYASVIFDSGTTGMSIANGGSAVELYPNTSSFTDVTTPISYSDYANAIGTMQYRYVGGTTTQTYTGRKKRAGLIVLTNSSYANVYFYNCDTSGTIYIKTLIEQIETNPVTYTTSGLTVTFTCVDAITMFAKEF